MTCCQSADMNRGRGGVGADLTPLDTKLCSQFAVCAPVYTNGLTFQQRVTQTISSIIGSHCARRL
jgi:hypothetical protein